MSPLDWSIVQSALLFLALPSFGVAVEGTVLSLVLVRGESYRCAAASIAWLAGLALGNAFSKVISVAKFETGWRSLFWATMLAVTIEIGINLVHDRRPDPIVSIGGGLILALLSGLLLTSWDETVSRPWMAGLFVSVICSNWQTLRFLGARRYGAGVPVLVAFIWAAVRSRS